jgi:SAM-dependent methyltransferase
MQRVERQDIMEKFTHSEGTVEIEELGGGHRRVTLHPKGPSTYVPRRSIETRYPVSLIAFILNDGFTWLCDAIARDDDPNYVHKEVKEELLAYCSSAEFTGRKILDFGCGSGASAMVLARLFPHSGIVGVDFNGKALRVAAELLKFYEFKNVEFHVSPVPPSFHLASQSSIWLY